MKVTVLGSGVIGVTSAYYLAKAGHEVTVLDRQAGPGLETSYANAGEISPGYASPWAAPGIPQKAIKWMLMKHAPLVLRPRLDPFMASWLGQMLRNCTNVRYAINKGRMVRLAEYSRDKLIELRAATGIHYDERQGGTLQLFRTQKQLDGIGKDVDVLRADGVPFEVLDVEGCVAVEPALGAVRDLFVGGLRLPGDETGDCFKFTSTLATMAEQLGVRFRYGVTIEAITHAGTRVEDVWDRRRAGPRRRNRGGARQPHPADAEAPRHQPAGLSGEGLFPHRADRRPEPGAGVDGDGRDLQDRHHPARRPHPRRRHGRDLRLQHRSAGQAARERWRCRSATCSPVGTSPAPPSGPACAR